MAKNKGRKRSNKKQHSSNKQHSNINKADGLKFEWGAAEPVNDIADLLDVLYDPFQDVYTPPISPKGLDALTRKNSTHRRCINFKVNQMAICFKQTGIVSLRDFRRAAHELETFGNCYFEKILNRAGNMTRMIHVPALNMRRKKDGGYKLLRKDENHIEYQAHEMMMASHYDTGQSIYGVPQWIGALQDVFLNSEATLFRRRYYLNGSHMGYILYTNDPEIDPEVEKALREKIAKGKGAGNFKSMYINIPGGDKDAVQIIPIGDISQKDEFERVKRISADDIVVGHGVPAQLAGMKPENVGGYGDIEKAGAWYRQSEVAALVHPFEELNEFLPGNKHFEFDLTK